jgi:hypothetical protein
MKAVHRVHEVLVPALKHCPRRRTISRRGRHRWPSACLRHFLHYRRQLYQINEKGLERKRCCRSKREGERERTCDLAHEKDTYLFVYTPVPLRERDAGCFHFVCLTFLCSFILLYM